MQVNPQLENGFTRLSNEILDELCKIRISGEAMQALLTVLRKTYGYHKKSDNISLSQLPKIKLSDSALPEDCNVGEVIKIERKGKESMEFFRVIIP